MPNVLQTLHHGVTIVLNVKWKPLCCWLPSGWVCWTKAIKQEPASYVGSEVVETPQVSYQCNCCAKVETQVPFPRSSQCQAIWYCSWSCLKELWPDHIIICQAIQELSQRVFTLQTAFISLLTPTQHAKVVNLVGRKCAVNSLLNDSELTALWDSGAQEWIMTKGLLEEILPRTAIRGISELINVGLNLHGEQFLTVSSEQCRRVFGQQ